MPTGFMPAAIADGGPFALCHGSSAATLALIDAHAAAHHGGMHGPIHGNAHDDDTSHSEHWDNCPLGVGSADAALAVSIDFESAETGTIESPPTPLARVVSGHIRHYLARAPPA